MWKKIIVIGMVFLMCLSFLGCTNKQYEYKETAKKQIINYINSKTSSDFSESNWGEILRIGEIGKTRINSATTEQEIDLIVCRTKSDMESIIPKKVDEIKDGAYFISDDSWELYVREYAKEKGKDQKWIHNALNGDEKTDLAESFYGRGSFWAAIVGGKMTISNGNRFSFDLLKRDDVYTENFPDSETLLWRINDCLFIKQGDDLNCFYYDPSYIVCGETNRKYEEPQEIQTIVGRNGESVLFQWQYKASYGTFGVNVEIKTGEEDFKTVKTERVFMNEFTVQVDIESFKGVENYVRLSHIGGPIIDNEKNVILYKDSDLVTFLVMIDNGIIIEAVKI